MKKLDQFALPVLADLARIWLESIEKSSSTLTAVFHNSSYKTKVLRDLVASVEVALELTPAANDSLEKRLICVSEAAVKEKITLDDGWNEVLPKLRAIVDTQQEPSMSSWKAASVARAVLRKT